MERIGTPPLPGAAKGVSLLEMLVVLILVSVLLATVSLNFIGKNANDAETAATRLLERLVALNDEAILQGQLYAVLFNKDGYQFMALNRNNELVPMNDDPLFRKETLPDGVVLSDFRINGAVVDDKAQILFDSTGLLPEFRLTVGNKDHQWNVSHTPSEGIRIDKIG